MIVNRWPAMIEMTAERVQTGDIIRGFRTVDGLASLLTEHEAIIVTGIESSNLSPMSSTAWLRFDGVDIDGLAAWSVARRDSGVFIERKGNRS